MRVPPVERQPRRSLGLRAWLIGAAVVLVILLLSLRGLARFYTDYLWFKDVGYTHTWRALLRAKAMPAIIFSTIFFILMLVNLIIADRVAPRYRSGGPEDEIIERYRSYVAPYAGRVRVLVSLFFAIVMGTGVSGQWQNWILFSNSVKFGIKDPQFHKDIGFYVFRLPFYQFAASWTFAALLVVLIVSAVFHYLNGGIRLQSPFQRVTPQVKVHLSVLLAAMALTKTVQYYLAQFALTLSHRGTVDGATFTDVHAQLPALRLLMVISIAAAALFIVNIWRRGWVFPIIAVGLWGFISIVVGTIYPAFIQQFRVKPNELTRETPYIQRNIDATRAAFNLDGITTNQFNYQTKLNAADTRAAQDSLDNIRLYDPDPAQQAFQIRQRFQQFYNFKDVDVDRYKIGAEVSKPTLAAVRELDLAHLPNNSWTNEHLVYTHGAGAVAAAADQVNGNEPSYVLQNIPPTGELTLDPNTSGVYFGEDLGSYAVVDTKVNEQEAAGTQGQTKTTKYQGKAGVQVSSFLRKAALAARFGDWTFLWSSQVSSQSRVIYLRDVKKRVETIAPFLRFDHDPYPVVVNGHITWIIDAYTTTSQYPYSQSLHPAHLKAGSGLDTDFNYVRNSVKATVDAYDGTVNFYIVDQTDPIIKAYAKAFPNMFQNADAMPAGFRDHWRYPEDIFDAQTEQYTQYHIQDPAQFYNKQAIWEVAPDPDVVAQASATTAPAAGNNGGRSTTAAGSDNPMDPLYLTMALPGQTQQEFVLEREFVPRNAANLASFMFARMDGANYGKLVEYDIASSNAPSPGQAATQINSDPTISGAFTLLDQAKSQVQRGAEQLLPIGNALVYVRPIFTIGEGSQTFPRYQYVAVSVGDQAVLGDDINDAMTGLLTGRPTKAALRESRGTTPGTTPGSGSTATTTPTTPSSVQPPPANATAQQLLDAANAEFDAAQAALQAGNLGSYQSHVTKGHQLLQQGLAKLGQSSGTTSTTKP